MNKRWIKDGEANYRAYDCGFAYDGYDGVWVFELLLSSRVCYGFIGLLLSFTIRIGVLLTINFLAYYVCYTRTTPSFNQKWFTASS